MSNLVAQHKFFPLWTILMLLVYACGSPNGQGNSVEDAGSVWTCSMHPQIRMNQPGDCPICGMELVTAKEPTEARSTDSMHDGMDHDTDSGGWACAMNCVPPLPEPGECPVCGMDMVPVEGSKSDKTPELSLSEEAARRAGISTSIVRRRFVTRELQVPGEVSVAEDRLSEIRTWVAGRVTAIHGARPGERVREGRPLYELYSPELLAAQRELLLPATREAARERLRLWGIAREDLEAIIAGGQVRETLPVRAEAGGIVLERLVEPGAQLAAGSRLFRLAELDLLWGQLWIDQVDLPHIDEGAGVTIRVDGLPGEEIRAEIAFIDPVLQAGERRARARVLLANAEGRLRVGQLLRAELEVPIRVDGRAPLSIPESAVLFGGERTLVYVQSAPGRYQPREILVGPAGDGWRAVLQGLEPGEEVVAEGAFRIDSALQIRGAASLMQPSEAGEPMQHEH